MISNKKESREELEKNSVMGYSSKYAKMGTDVKPKQGKITYEPPKEMDTEKIIYWSPTLKRLMKTKKGKAIKTKALKFLRHKCVKYDKKNKCFWVNPIKGYNKTTYKIEGDGKHFKCNCQFYNKVSKEWDHPVCSHIQATKLYLEIKNWNKKQEQKTVKLNMLSSDGETWYETWAKILDNQIVNMGCECLGFRKNNKNSLKKFNKPAYKSGMNTCKHCKHLLRKIYIMKKNGKIIKEQIK